MGKSKGATAARNPGSRFFKWIRSDLPDEEDQRRVLLLGVTKINDSPSLGRRTVTDANTSTLSARYYRPPKSKYQRGHQCDERLEQIRQELQTHRSLKPAPSDEVPTRDYAVELRRKNRTSKCLTLCVGHNDTIRSYKSTNRASFIFQRPEDAPSYLENHGQISGNAIIDFSDSLIEHRYSEIDTVQRKVPQVFTNVKSDDESTPRPHDRKIFSNLNERFRKTLSLDSRKVDRPKSVVETSSPKSVRSEDTLLGARDTKQKKKRFRPKSLFALEGFFDSKKSDSSADDYCSSKYKKFELELDDSPLLNERNRTPDLLDSPVITELLRKNVNDNRTAKARLEKIENYYKLNSAQSTSKAKYEDDEVEYIEPFKSNFTSQSTLVVDVKNKESALLRADSILSIDKLVDSDNLGRYEIEVKPTDLHGKVNDLVVMIMDKSIDSIGSCSLDVDASTDYSDTTSGSLNLLTPSSTASRVRDFTARIHERVNLHRALPTQQELPQVVISDATSQKSTKTCISEPHKKPSYLNLSCSVSGYSKLTAYDSKQRQNINKSRESSPVRPIACYKTNTDLLVPVPVSSDKLVVPEFLTHEVTKHLTPEAVRLSQMENKQLRDNFLMDRINGVKPKGKDEVDKLTSDVYKTSKKITSSFTYVNGRNETKITSEFTIHNNNGITKHVEIVKENGEKLTSPMKSFIQQRVERLYGPGALAQGFFNQKRQKDKSVSEYDEILDKENITKDFDRSLNGADSLPVLRHLRPEFRAQLPILSPKKTLRQSTSPTKSDEKIIPIKIETAAETPVLNGHKDVKVTESLVNSVSELNVKEDRPSNGVVLNGVCVKDGHYFLELKKNETDRLIALAVSAESDLEALQQQGDEVSEEVLGLLRSAAGKARLLATQKMQQFEGLCYNNINRRADEPFPTTSQDLEGFWDMVSLQCRNVDALFVQLEELRANGWKEIQKTPVSKSRQSNGQSSRPNSASKRSTPTSNTSSPSQKSKQAADKRDADRKAMLEMKRKLAREKMSGARASTDSNKHDATLGANQEVEIYVGKNSSLDTTNKS